MRVYWIIGLIWLAGAVPAPAAMTVADGGRAVARIVVAADAIPAETTAAHELADYLGRVTGADFAVEQETAQPVQGPAILIGPSRMARAGSTPPSSLDSEGWIIRRSRQKLLLYGGRPRGTLYAVYHFLEDELGIRWWTPYEESVPHRPTLRVARLDRQGQPVFAYRGISGISGPAPFSARNRHNGHRARLSWKWGGVQSYGPPFHVHTFYLYLPLEQYFDEHPEYFSEIGGLRYNGPGQLCLTNPDLFDEVTRLMRGFIKQARAKAELEGEPPPLLFAFSQNDWKKPCTCSACSAIVAREGSESGPVVDFVNRLADRIAARDPEIAISTLAYQFTFKPPKTLQVHDNVIIYYSALHQRDFGKSLAHPDNRVSLDALRGWSERASRLRVWGYSVLFGDYGEFPLPNLQVLRDDFRLYARLGVEGLFVQHEYPIAADMRDLKLWMMLKLMEQPHADYHELLVEFTDGYYGPAGKPIRHYLRLLERALARQPVRLEFGARPEAYAYLDLDLLARAHGLFERAARRVAGQAELSRRVLHARLTLDRATLVRWNELMHGSEADARRGPATVLDWDTVARRYGQTWSEQIELRMPEESWPAARAEVQREIDYWSARRRSD